MHGACMIIVDRSDKTCFLWVFVIGAVKLTLKVTVSF